MCLWCCCITMVCLMAICQLSLQREACWFSKDSLHYIVVPACKLSMCVDLSR